MKEPNLGLMARNLLETATALAGILDQTIKGNSITVNFSYAAELIASIQVAAHSAAQELLFIEEEKGGAR